jgi:hypothetical protein
VNAMPNKLFGIVKGNIEPLLEEGVPIALEAALDGIIGQMASGLVSFRLSFKQRKFEENTKIALSSLNQKASSLERKLENLSEDFYNFINTRALPLTFDYAIEENEVEKIELIINGLETIIEEMISEEEIILTYNDVLRELRYSEIVHLLKYDPRSERMTLDLSMINLAMDRSGEAKRKYAQRKGHENYVTNKLERLNLIETIIIDGGSFPEIKKQSLTDFGRNFLNFFKVSSITNNT